MLGREDEVDGTWTIAGALWLEGAKHFILIKHLEYFVSVFFHFTSYIFC